MKKTIALAGILAAASVSAQEIKNGEQALDQLTGPNQPLPQESTICLAVNPYFITSRTPGGTASSFIGFNVNGTSAASSKKPACKDVLPEGQCERGYVKVTSTAPLLCTVPIGL